MGEEVMALYSSPDPHQKKVKRAAAQQGNKMIADKSARIVLTTCGSAAEAKRIAEAMVKKRLAACVNIVPGPLQSIYRWKGKVESARELLLICKTTAGCLAQLERELSRLHSYDVPEFLVIKIAAGSQPYLRWLTGSVKK
jgi:periplasmic divalent cation tolerance protein